MDNRCNTGEAGGNWAFFREQRNVDHWLGNTSDAWGASATDSDIHEVDARRQKPASDLTKLSVITFPHIVAEKDDSASGISLYKRASGNSNRRAEKNWEFS